MKNWFKWALLFLCCVAICKCAQKPEHKPAKPFGGFIHRNAKGPFHYWTYRDSLGQKEELLFEADGTIRYFRNDTTIDSVSISPEAFKLFRKVQHDF